MSIEEILNIKNIEDYESIGSIEEIKDFLNQICKPLYIDSKTYEELYETINVLKEKWVDFLPGPFINKEEEYIFYLTCLDGKIRNKLLGITDELYDDKKKAEIWYKSIAKIVHPDKTKAGKTDAFISLNRLYANMIDYDGDE